MHIFAYTQTAADCKLVWKDLQVALTDPKFFIPIFTMIREPNKSTDSIQTQQRQALDILAISYLFIKSFFPLNFSIAFFYSAAHHFTGALDTTCIILGQYT